MIQKNRERLMVSNPPSAFGIYLPDELIEHLGGIGARVEVHRIKQSDGSWKFTLRRSKKAKSFIRKSNGSTLDARILWRDKINRPLHFEFKSVYLLWEYNDDEVQFILPPKSKLQVAHTKSKATVKQPLLMREGKIEVKESNPDEALLANLLKDPVIAGRIKELSGK